MINNDCFFSIVALVLFYLFFIRNTKNTITNERTFFPKTKNVIKTNDRLFFCTC